MNNIDEIELVIVDNNSTDSTLNTVKSYEKDINIQLIENPINEGFTGACNSGALNSKGNFLFITNQDVLFPPDFFEKLSRIYNDFSKNHEIVISPALVFETGRIHYFGAKNHFLGFSYTPEVGEELPKNKIIKKTQRFSGGTLFIKKDLFLKMGGFYKKFFMYYEDTDLSLKLLRNGYKIYTTNEPYLIHQKKYQTLNDFQYYFLERNRFILIIRNVSGIRKLLPIIIVVELILIFHPNNNDVGWNEYNESTKNSSESNIVNNIGGVVRTTSTESRVNSLLEKTSELQVSFLLELLNRNICRPSDEDRRFQGTDNEGTNGRYYIGNKESTNRGLFVTKTFAVEDFEGTEGGGFAERVGTNLNTEIFGIDFEKTKIDKNKYFVHNTGHYDVLFPTYSLSGSSSIHIRLYIQQQFLVCIIRWRPH